jgi:predicted Zn-dependent protease
MKPKTCLLLLCFILSGCATTDLPPVTPDSVLEDDEERLWLRSEEEQEVIDQSGLLYEDIQLDVYLNRVARRLQSPEIWRSIPFQIKVIEDPHLNAFAYPNGVIYVHTGILARMDNEAQLATLLAHEMTHATHRHAVKNFRSIKNKTAILATIQVSAGGLGGGIGDLVNVLGSLGTMAAVTGYSRELETEADTVGIDLMVAAGYDPREAPKLFIHIKRELEEEDIREPFFFGTHPRLQNRIDNYESFLENRYQDYYGGLDNSDIFLEKVHRVILNNAVLDLRAGRFKTAQRGAQRYLRLRPNDAEAYHLLGEVSRQRGEEGDWEVAKDYYRKAIAIDPLFPESHRGLGLICFKKGQKTPETTHFDTYLSLKPQASDRLYTEEYIRQCE